MGLKTIELKLQLRQTREFINSDKTMIVLNRLVVAQDQMGGRTQTDRPLAPQVARVVPARSRSTSMIYTLPTGETVSSKDYLLIGMPELDVELKDWFMYQNMAFQVSYINPDRQIHTLCQLDLLGPSARSTV